MTGEILREAVVRPDQFGRPEIGFVLTGPGSELFYAYTSAHVGDQLAIVLDGRVLSAPNINQAIRDQGVISGQFTNEEAESLAVQMRYGALPISLKVVDVRTIGATLGADSVRSSVVAGIIGLIAVFIFMITLFRLSGVIASVALILYILFNLAIYKLVPITLTLAGIAGFLLSIGMAVDANILIFSRMREELRGGRSLRLAVEAGFSRAWPAILDSNLTTLISCAVLFWFGSTFGASVVKGYALNLAVGVAISMLTAVYITRSFMRALIGNRTNMTDAQARSMVGM
jgi:preprotein translocase subunit SecD